MDVKGKLVVVTGGASGIGRAYAGDLSMKVRKRLSWPM